jgi:hypothetical protein
MAPETARKCNAGIKKAKGRELPDLPKLTSTPVPVHPWSKMEISYSLCVIISLPLRRIDDAWQETLEARTPYKSRLRTR